MIYATRQDIVDRYNEETLMLVFDRNRVGAVDEMAVVKALADASAEIDSYLASRYELPLPAVPAAVVGYCVDIAVYRGTDSPVVPEERRKRYEDAIRWARLVGEGKIKLSLPADTADAPASSAASLQTASPARIFDRDTLERY